MAWTVTLLAAIAIGLATLRPLPGTPPITTTWCIFCGQYGGTDFILNVALFFPLGVGLGLTRTRRAPVLLTVFLATVFIELAQYRFLAGRDASLGDIVANFTGGSLGFAAARTAGVWIRPSSRTARWLAAGYAAFWLSALSFTSWLWQPSVPHFMYGSQWQPRHREFFPFSGRLIELSMNRSPLEPATMIELRLGTPPLANGVHTVTARFRAGPPSPSLAPIARLGQTVAEAFLLARDGDLLAFRTRLRSADARLRVPLLALRAFTRVSPSDTVRATAGLLNGSLFATLESRSESASRTMPLTPGMGWAMLVPFNLPLAEWSVVVSALWVAFSLVPLGFWSAGWFGGGRSARLVMLAAALTTTALVVVPRSFGSAPAGMLELASGAAGLVGGAILSARRHHKNS